MVTKAICRRLPVLFLAFFCAFSSTAQDIDRLSADFHRGRREALRQQMPANSVSIVFTNPVRKRSNDVDYQFSQDPNFYYLTGLIEADAALLLFKDSIQFEGIKTSEILFVEGPNAASRTWSGPVLKPEEVKDSLGIAVACLNSRYKEVSPILCGKLLWIIWPDQPRKAGYSDLGLPLLVDQTKAQVNSCKLVPDTLSLPAAMAALREVKLPEELLLMNKAISLTSRGFQQLMKRAEPGMKEYQAQAIVEYEAKMGGSEYQGYPSISGAGNNGCVLHYTANRSELKKGDLLLADMGAEYHGYTADITRTIPVSGKFTEPQRIIYELVLKAQEAGIAACVPGNEFRSSHYAAKKVITEGLLQLGIIQTETEVTTYFMHGTSHYLGLDVHDAGTKGPYTPGTVITVEPGIYIRKGANCDPKWWDIGVRIEDDILITSVKPVILSADIPRTPAAIEALMAEPSNPHK